MGYRFALFDADNTLLDFSAAERAAITFCLKVRELPFDAETLACYSRINELHWKALERGETTRDRLKVERFADFFRALSYEGDPSQMASDYIGALSRESALIDGALELIKSLHGKCELYIVTNGITAVQKSRFSRCALSPYFNACFISEEMGCAKPDKVFFDLVAASIEGFDPQEAIVIGDSLSSDVQGGINAGLDTCWYNPHGAEVPREMKITYTVRSLGEIEQILLN